jgi:hypothetical protein
MPTRLPRRHLMRALHRPEFSDGNKANCPAASLALTGSKNKKAARVHCGSEKIF